MSSLSWLSGSCEERHVSRQTARVKTLIDHDRRSRNRAKEIISITRPKKKKRKKKENRETKKKEGNNCSISRKKGIQGLSVGDRIEVWTAGCADSFFSILLLHFTGCSLSAERISSQVSWNMGEEGEDNDEHVWCSQCRNP